MADGRHLAFRFWAIISASTNISAPNWVQWWKIGSRRGPSAQKADFFVKLLKPETYVFSVRSIAGSSIQWMMNDPKRGRGHGHVAYFWSNGTDTRVPQNVFLVTTTIRNRRRNEKKIIFVLRNLALALCLQWLLCNWCIVTLLELNTFYMKYIIYRKVERDSTWICIIISNQTVIHHVIW